MRAIFIGASATALVAVRQILDRGHEAVVVEKDGDRVEALSEEIDCSFVHADGSRPATLNELSPENADMLCCLTDSDHDNIIAGLVARSLGFERVVVKITDSDLEPICTELGLKDVIIPAREVGISLVDLLEGREHPDLSDSLKGGWRFWQFTVAAKDAGAIGALELPERARVLALTRGDETRPAEPSLELEPGDHVLLLAHRDVLDQLSERFETSRP